MSAVNKSYSGSDGPLNLEVCDCMTSSLLGFVCNAMLAARRGIWIRDDASLNLIVGSSLLWITLSLRSSLNF